MSHSTDRHESARVPSGTRPPPIRRAYSLSGCPRHFWTARRSNHQQFPWIVCLLLLWRMKENVPNKIINGSKPTGESIYPKNQIKTMSKNDAPTCLPITGLARGAPHPMNNLLYNYLDRLFNKCQIPCHETFRTENTSCSTSRLGTLYLCIGKQTGSFNKKLS